MGWCWIEVLAAVRCLWGGLMRGQDGCWSHVSVSVFGPGQQALLRQWGSMIFYNRCENDRLTDTASLGPCSQSDHGALFNHLSRVAAHYLNWELLTFNTTTLTPHTYQCAKLWITACSLPLPIHTGHSVTLNDAQFWPSKEKSSDLAWRPNRKNWKCYFCSKPVSNYILRNRQSPIIQWWMCEAVSA